jgi:hypothetical protein
MADSNSTVTLRPPVWALLTAVIIGGLFYIAGKHLEIKGPLTNPPVISVSADAKVSTPPDIAMMSFGVTSGRQTTAKAATESVNKSMAKIIAAVKELGVEDKDITTESFYLSPEYDYTTGGQIPRGFQASQSLRVKVRDLDKAGDVLTAATTAGANQAGGITFSVDNPDEAKARARQMAIEKAKAKAKVLADELGMSLGRMTGFSEDGVYPISPMMKANYDMGVGGAMVQNAVLPAGEQDIVSNVTITYELR